MLTVETRKVVGVSSRTMTTVPNESLLEASLTEMACPVVRACVIATQLSAMEM